MATGRVPWRHLTLLLIATLVSLAQTSQGGIPDSNHKISTRKVIIKVAATAAMSKNWLGGRKMAVEIRQMKKLKDVRMNGAAGGTWKFLSTNSKCESNLGCEQTLSHSSDPIHGVDESGFVAFNADYHAPRHHPPKNN